MLKVSEVMCADVKVDSQADIIIPRPYKVILGPEVQNVLIVYTVRL